jgi:peptidoglycan/xylan/chitin deacetylase (PgdA/CDA1 family)
MPFSYVGIGLVVACTVFAGCNKPSSNQSKTKVETTGCTVDSNTGGKTNANQASGDAKLNETKPNTPAQVLAKPEVPILCYHRIANGKKGDYTVTPEQFEEQIKTLADSGYQSISPDQLYDYLVFNHHLPEKPVMITFDDSRLEHATIAAPVLEKSGFRGVFFIMTITYGKKNYMSTGQIAGLSKAGHIIGLHTWDHQMVTKYQDSTDWQKEIVAPLKKLTEITGSPVEYFAYPNGVFNSEGSCQLSEWFKLSFILSGNRDPDYPLQTVRRMIATNATPKQLLVTMRRTFKTV